MTFWSFGISLSVFIYSLIFDRTLVLIFGAIGAIYVIANIVHQRGGLNDFARKKQIATWNDAGQPRVFGRQEIDITEVTAFLEDYNRNHPDTPLSMVVLFAKALGQGLWSSKKLIGRITFGQFILSDQINISVFVDLGDQGFGRVLLEDCNGQSIKQLADQLKAKTERLRNGFNQSRPCVPEWLGYLPTLLVQSALKLITWLNYDWALPLPFLHMNPCHFGFGILADISNYDVADWTAPLVPGMKSVFACILNTPKPRPVFVDDKLVIRNVQYFNLSFDHRFGDGADAIKLLAAMYEVVGNPRKYL